MKIFDFGVPCPKSYDKHQHGIDYCECFHDARVYPA
jgi:hypothetical protein